MHGEARKEVKKIEEIRMEDRARHNYRRTKTKAM